VTGSDPTPFDRLFLGTFPELEPVDVVIPPAAPLFERGPVSVRVGWRVELEASNRVYRLLRLALLRRNPWAAYDRTPELLAEVAAVLPPDEARLVLQAGEPSGGAA